LVSEPPAALFGPKPLDEVEIAGLLVSSEFSGYLARLVQQGGIDFCPVDEYLNRLRNVGGQDPLLQAIRTAKQYNAALPNPTATSVLQHLFQGSEFEKQSLRAQAEQEYRAALQLDGQNPVLDLVVGHVLFEENKLDDAVEAWKRAVFLRPDSAVAHADLGVALWAKGRLKESIDEEKTAIKLQGGYANAHGYLGLDLEAEQNLDGAIAELRLACLVQPDERYWYMQLGNALGYKSDWDEGIKALGVAIQLNPADAVAHAMLGELYSGKGDGFAAMAESSRAIYLNQNYAFPHYTLGLGLLTQNHDRKGSRKQFRIACQLQPINSPYCAAAADLR
jgi:tetratricopeptide (TPR) repeat protein